MRNASIKVFEFVTEWEQSHPGRLSRQDVYAAFSARYPAATYSNPASLCETLYRERKRRGLGCSDPKM
jgi:hypothetical protein